MEKEKEINTNQDKAIDTEIKKEKILIGIPAYGGNVHVFCFKSVLQLFQNEEILKKYDLQLVSMHNEALISRARQELAKFTLDNHCDRLFFIDADIAFSSKQFMAILEADKDVIGGTYMMKTLNNPRLNFNLPTEIHQEMSQKYKLSPISLPGFDLLRRDYCQESPIIKARHVPTGFLCIKSSVLEKLKDKVPKYISNRNETGQVYFNPEEVEKMRVSEIFPVSVQNNALESEDWGFCRLCNENDIDVHLHTDVVVEHVGQVVFHPSLFISKN